MNTEDASRIWRFVWRRMGQWESDGGVGSARPEFERSWRDAIGEIKPGEPPTPIEREQAWKRWLESGAESTSESRAAILESARTRAKDGQLFGFDAIRRLHREPGQEG